MSSKGGLVLVGTPIGNLGDLSPRAITALRDADVIAAEDTRRTRALLTHAQVPAGRRLIALHAHNERSVAVQLVDRMRSGARVAYVTDAGMPGISDPGERLVRACLDADVPVEVVPGPSALVAALVTSGLPTGRFVFEGFLPRKGKERSRRLEALVAEERTVVIYESPRRVAATLADLAAALGADRGVAVARELTKVFEEVRRGTLGEVAARYEPTPHGPATDPPRGEHVIVVAPSVAGEGEQVDDDAIDAALRELLLSGMSARDASTAAARELGVPRRRAYERALVARKHLKQGGS